MTQEVEITIRGEFNAELDANVIKSLIQDVLDGSGMKPFVPLKVIGIKEEAELYGPHIKPIKQCLNEVSVDHGWNHIGDVIMNAKNRFVISSIMDLAIDKFQKQKNEENTNSTPAKGEGKYTTTT